MTFNLGERRDEEPRRVADRDDDDGMMRVRWSIVFQIVGYALGLFVVYNALTNRMTAQEIRYESISRDVSEMKADIKTLLRKSQ